jgi:hypothetical protein
MNYNNHSFLSNNNPISLANGNFVYNSAGTLSESYSATISLAVTDNTWNAMLGIVNGASSALSINNGTATTGNAGAGNLTATTSAIGSRSGSPTFYSSDMYLDTYVVFNTNPGSTPLTNFITWIRANKHT